MSPRLPWIALTVVYVLWGSTYLANRFVLPSVPPLLVGGLPLPGREARCWRRSSGWVGGRSALRMARHSSATTALSGLLLPGWATGWSFRAAGRVVRSGGAAARGGAPVDRHSPGDDRRPPAERQQWGVAVGVIGPGGAPAGRACVRRGAGNSLVGAVAGGAREPRPGDRDVRDHAAAVPPNPFALAAVQMMTGGVVLLSIGTAAGERLDVAAVTTSAWVTWAYLSVVVSLGAFSAYAYALANLPVSTVATYAYVNPVIALVLGALRRGRASPRCSSAAPRSCFSLSCWSCAERRCPKTSGVPWQHPGMRHCRGRDDRGVRRPAGPRSRRRGSARRGRPAPSAGGTSARCWGGCGSCSSIR